VQDVSFATLSPINAKRRAVQALFVGRPLSAAYFDEPRLHRAIAKSHADAPPDLVIVYSSNVAQFAADFRATPRIMYFSDLDSRKWAQYACHAKGPMRFVYALEAKRLLAHERAIAHSFSHSVVATPIELAEFHGLIPGARVSLVRNGVDLGEFRPTGRPKRPGTMIFTGVMDYFPNIDAVTWFADQVLPRVRATRANAHFVICGSSPAAAVRRLGERPGITVTGSVPDTRPFLEEAELFVAPLRMARGIQNKLLQAMAIGLPCVTSSPCRDATGIPEGEGMLAADAPELFAERILALLGDPGYRNDQARRARAAVKGFGWEAQLERLDRVVDVVVGASKARALETI
ncbi:MAG: TIGR03087 family PEP-CTERM/XrtA system glycosyltransferase, partial [Stellaceae bacterium]